MDWLSLDDGDLVQLAAIFDSNAFTISLRSSVVANSHRLVHLSCEPLLCTTDHFERLPLGKSNPDEPSIVTRNRSASPARAQFRSGCQSYSSPSAACSASYRLP